jgi:predicted nucleotidyltransferase
MVKPLKSNEELIRATVEVIKEFLPDAVVIVYGSRAKGNYRPNSDLDVAILTDGEVPAPLMAQIREKLDELPTLVSFDLVDLNTVSESFKKVILKEGKVVYDGRGEKKTRKP